MVLGELTPKIYFYNLLGVELVILIFYIKVFDITSAGVYTGYKGSKLEVSPTIMEHEVTEDTAGRCYSASWTADGNVVCSESKLVRIRNGDDLKSLQR